MHEKNQPWHVGRELVASARAAGLTLAVCVVLYGLAVLAFGRLACPARAAGSLVRDAQGKPVGSALIAQAFTRPEHLWPRPSAVDYNAAAAGGSNLSPASPELRARAEACAVRLGADPAGPVPADLATASGSGLDPHVTLTAARYQAARIARARGVPKARVLSLLERHAERHGGPFTTEPLVNVLRVNRALDTPGAW